MKEFGSDFHLCDHDFRGASDYFDMLGHMRLYACGRHAIDAIIKQEGWKRIWMPAYFCYEVIQHIVKTGIKVCFYNDFPLSEEDDKIIRSLPFEKGDVLLRTDYFGVRKKRTNESIPVSVIEDHTHGLITEWALKSDADWCIASLRKTLPVAAGGILWSPKGSRLPDTIQASESCKEMAKIRYEAMRLKKKYLKAPISNIDANLKEEFREKYIVSEDMIDNLSLSGIDAESKEITESLNIKQWIELKLDNWHQAISLLDKRFKVLGTEINDYWQPFSLVFLMETADEREALRKYMIQHHIYPAILWRMPNDSPYDRAKDFSERMLSVHCDIRYNCSEIEELCKTINGFYDSNI